MIRYGSTARGTKRWRCAQCGVTCTTRNKGNRFHRQFNWFKKWITQGFTIKQITEASGHSRRMVRAVISYWLKHPPVQIALSPTTSCLFDGTYLQRSHGLLAMMDIHQGILAGTYGLTEKPGDLEQFFGALATRGLKPSSVTVDGNPNVLRALRKQWSNIIIQRCLVHIQRQGLMWCRRFPKRLDARKLRTLFLTVVTITTNNERDIWLTQLASWEARYGNRIATSRETGWVFSDLKRARCMLLRAIPGMFHYLDHPEIPRTTNGLEGYFGRLKDRYHDHRGLAQTNRSAYFQWYFYLCPR